MFFLCPLALRQQPLGSYAATVGSILCNKEVTRFQNENAFGKTMLRLAS
jgi:hypothetical protein